MNDLSKLMKTDPETGTRMLLRQYGGLAYCIVRRVLKGYPEDDVEECVSDVFYYLYRHRKRLDFSDGALKAYLIKTAEHRAIDHQRKCARMPVPQEDALWEATASERSAEEEALCALSREELIDRIRALGEPDASILLMKYWLDLTCADIGERLGMRPNTVAVRAGRALKRIRETWKGEAE
ncbi:MAG: sigma-70 family RNA polymerase sigma factor [Clostridia bacterium]|nr:sigma-70 family RNA polymerase sigma factor [Clostridia bacterium]